MSFLGRGPIPAGFSIHRERDSIVALFRFAMSSPEDPGAEDFAAFLRFGPGYYSRPIEPESLAILFGRYARDAVDLRFGQTERGKRHLRAIEDQLGAAWDRGELAEGCREIGGG